jgi:Na+-transporting NADH:ubiquinone oxidoreductase subunit F
MNYDPGALRAEQRNADYSLVGKDSKMAVEAGLAEAEWYQCYVPREKMRQLLVRRDGPAIRDTLIWFVLLGISAFLTFRLWGSVWAAIPYAFYCVLYSQTSDSRWHETSHGTAFKTDWMNNALYELASFMVKREATVWRWSHSRHHSDTIIVGRDPEISISRPPDLTGLLLGLFSLHPDYWKKLFTHAGGRIRPDEQTYIPRTEFGKVYFRARVYLAVYFFTIMLSLFMESWMPVLLVVFPNVFGTWLLYVYNLTQHAGLAENVLDHRLNCRTVHMNFLNRFLYWNMNYHAEHHMFPLVPYHALPALHECVKDQMPAPYPSIFAAWSEIIPTVIRQMTDRTYYVKRQLPDHFAGSELDTRNQSASGEPDGEGWVDVGPSSNLPVADVIRFDHGRKTYAIYRDAIGALYATDGICTHGNTHLSTGLVHGKVVECSKHNGRFNLADGSPARAPVCRALATYPVEERSSRLYLNVLQPGGAGARAESNFALRVVSNRNVATYIKELMVEPVDPSELIAFTPGDYVQFEIPTFEDLSFGKFDISDPFAATWRNQGLFDLVANNDDDGRRNNYSIASNAASDSSLRFNVRIGLSAPIDRFPPGVGSSYLFNLKAGDILTAIGPFGDFHIKPTQREMVYIGGGAGMAPLRAHLSHLFETEGTARKVTFWYGARSLQELFYRDYFEQLSAAHSNFEFKVALSSPGPNDAWHGSIGLIHEVVFESLLKSHTNPAACEYYLCGPPAMVEACRKMLDGIGVPPSQISFDAF